MIKAIVFDLDDTLFEERFFVISGFKAVAEALNKIYPHKLAEEYFGLMSDLFENGRRGDIFNHVLIMLEVEDTEIIPELVEVYRNHHPKIELCADAKEVLFELKSKNYKTGIITDGYSHVQRNKIKALNIENIFDVIIYTDDYGHHNWKPSELPYKLCLEKLNVTPKETMFIGDNPTKDFTTAKKLGIHTVRIRRQNAEYSKESYTKKYEAEYEIENLMEILYLLNNI